MINISIGIFECIMTFIAGIGAFLYGCKLLGGNVDSIAGVKLRKLIKKFSSNPLSGILFGTFLSFVLQSGTASVGMVIGLAVVDIITTIQAIYIVIGINIGTSLAIILLGFTGSSFSLTALFMALTTVGVFVTMFSKTNKTKAIGNIITGFGISFVGVIMIGKGTSFIANSDTIKQLLTSVNSIWASSLFGCILTLITQSTTSLITMMTGMAEYLQIDQCGYILFASNIGTAIATLLFVGITSNRKGYRISMSYLVLKIIGYIAFTVFTVFVPWVGGLNLAFTNSAIAFISQNSYLWTLIFVNIIYSLGTGILCGVFNKLLIKIVYLIVPITEKIKEAHISTESSSVAMVQIGIKIQNIFLEYAVLLEQATNFVASRENDNAQLINDLKAINVRVDELLNSLFSLGGVIDEDEMHIKTCLTNTIIGVEKSVTNTIKLLNSTKIKDKRVYYTKKQQPFIEYLTQRLLLISRILSQIINSNKNGEDLTIIEERMSEILNTLDECVEKKVEAKKYIITAEHSTERAIKEYTSFGNVINYYEEISTNLTDLSLNLAGFINSNNNKTSEIEN